MRESSRQQGRRLGANMKGFGRQCQMTCAKTQNEKTSWAVLPGHNVMLKWAQQVHDLPLQNEPHSRHNKTNKYRVDIVPNQQPIASYWDIKVSWWDKDVHATAYAVLDLGNH